MLWGMGVVLEFYLTRYQLIQTNQLKCFLGSILGLLIAWIIGDLRSGLKFAGHKAVEGFDKQ